MQRIPHKDENKPVMHDPVEYYEKLKKRAKSQFKPFLKLLNQLQYKGQYLEIGTGAGILTSAMANNFPNVKITAVELFSDMIDLGTKHIKTKLREVEEICNNFLGVDPITQLIPVRPAQHYTMAGVRTNKDGAAYGLKGLFSAGEAACWDMHGFNRLGGNSLAETIVAGKIVGEKIAEFLKGYEVHFKTAVIKDAVAKDYERIDKLIACKDGKESAFEVRNAMQDELMERVGIFRNGADLQKAVDNLQEIHARAKKVGLRSNGIGVNPELTLAIKIQGMVKLAICTAYGALQRTESRGWRNGNSHFDPSANGVAITTSSFQSQ